MRRAATILVEDSVVALAFFDLGTLRPNRFPAGTLREEIGHSFDHAVGYPWQINRKFKKAYVRRLPQFRQR